MLSFPAIPKMYYICFLWMHSTWITFVLPNPNRAASILVSESQLIDNEGPIQQKDKRQSYWSFWKSLAINLHSHIMRMCWNVSNEQIGQVAKCSAWSYLRNISTNKAMLGPKKSNVVQRGVFNMI